MLANRKIARDRLKSMRTVVEFDALMNTLTVTECQREAVYLAYVKRLSYVQIAEAMGVSTSCAKRLVAEVLDKI